METFKTFEILKNSSRDCLQRTNKTWKAFSKISENRKLYAKSFRSIVSLSWKTVSNS